MRDAMDMLLKDALAEAIEMHRENRRLKAFNFMLSVACICLVIALLL